MIFQYSQNQHRDIYEAIGCAVLGLYIGWGVGINNQAVTQCSGLGHYSAYEQSQTPCANPAAVLFKLATEVNTEVVSLIHR